MESPGASEQDTSLMEVSMALLVACAQRKLRQAQEQHSQRIDKAFKKLTKSRENLARLDQNIRRAREMDHILGSLDDMTKVLEDNMGKAEELGGSLEEMSQKLSAMKNNNITWGGEGEGEALRGAPDFAEGVEKDVQDLTQAVDRFAQSANTFLRDNCQLEDILECSVFE